MSLIQLRPASSERIQETGRSSPLFHSAEKKDVNLADHCSYDHKFQ